MDVSNVSLQGGFIRNGMTRSECEGEAILAVLAGNDTTAVSPTPMRLKVYCADEI